MPAGAACWHLQAVKIAQTGSNEETDMCLFVSKTVALMVTRAPYKQGGTSQRIYYHG